MTAFHVWVRGGGELQGSATDLPGICQGFACTIDA
jgi:hypothetical protein